MNLRQMENLLTIMETKNISRAAEKSYISQSGMSQQLSGIERELGVSLFQRVNNELLPTREGEIYLRYAREILGLHARAKKEMGNGMLQQIFPVFQKDYPDIHFHIVENHMSALEQMVCSNQVDISEAAYSPQIASSLSDRVKHMDLYTERIMLIMPCTLYYREKLEKLGGKEEEALKHRGLGPLQGGIYAEDRFGNQQ